MSQLSKFINLMIEYGQKIQSSLNKKYKSFIRSICNLQQLAKTVDPQNITLTRQIIIFKLGLQSKSTKSIQTSLIYLHKFFIYKFIDLNTANHCEQFQIEQNTIRKKQNMNIRSDLRTQLLKLLQPLIHFKNQQINILLLRVYQQLITQPIAPILISLIQMTPCQLGQRILFNYFNYRFYIFQQIYTFTQSQFKSINPLSIRNQRINQQIQQAFVNHENLLDLVHKYVGEIVAAVAKIGGKYGLCVICKEPADYYCKITKASLCSGQCKKIHLQLAEKQYKIYFQAVNLWKQIQPNFQLLLQELTKKQTGAILNVLVSLLQKAHLFMIVKKQFRNLISKYTPSIIKIAMNYKDQTSFQIIYNFIAVISRFWILQCVSSIEYFFKESLLKILEDKKPNFKMIIIVFKALAKIFEYGKNTIELYVNFDCQYNKTNIIQRTMFQISRICQDKFASNITYNKNQKIALKNSAVTLLSIITKGLNQYRLMYPQRVQIQQILFIKQRKTHIQKFILKFNQHWSQGLKILFNLNMVGLDSHKEIIQLIINTKGLKKQKIEDFLLSQNGRQYINTLFEIITENGPFMGLIEFFKVLPLKKSSILLKHFSDFVLKKFNYKMNKDQQLQSDKQKLNVIKWSLFLNSSYKLQQLKLWLQKQQIPYGSSCSLQQLYISCLYTRNQLTHGCHKTFFRHCISSSYLQIFTSQLSLLQIPILYLIQTQYPLQKVFQILSSLIQICPYSNWITLCLKNVDIDKIKQNKYTNQDHLLIAGCLKLAKNNAEFINDWENILNFLAKLYKIITNMEYIVKKSAIIIKQQDGLKIREEITVLQIEQYLLQIGNNCKKNFSHFIISLIHLSEEQLIKENVFFLQKTFQIIQQNQIKFIQNFNIISKQIQLLIKKNTDVHKQIKSNNKINEINNKKSLYSTQTMIYISDMLKQLFAKILKLKYSKKDNKIVELSQKKLKNYQQQDQQQHQHYQQIHQLLQPSSFSQIQLKLFKLFFCILEQSNPQVNFFIMNSITMLILHQYNLSSSSFTFIISILKQFSSEYKQQTINILTKIIKEHFRNCQQLQFDIINICIDMVENKDKKIQIQILYLLKDIINVIMANIKAKNMNQTSSDDEIQQTQHLKIVKQQIQMQQSQVQISPNKSNISQLEQEQLNNKDNKYGLKKGKYYLIFIIQQLIQFITYECHQTSIQILFTLLKTPSPTKINASLLSVSQTNLIISKIFSKLQSLPRIFLPRAQKIMNQSLFWSVRNKNHHIIKSLEYCIIDKYSSLSYCAMKCIKTFISMTNPKKQQQWKPIQETLVKILKNTHLSDFVQINIQENKTLEFMIENNQYFKQQQYTNINITQLSNKLIIQRMVVEVLPNDVKIIDQLLKIYQQTVQFNDNIYLRCLLWRQGLGNTNKISPPDILSLQQLISYRIISTYYYSKQLFNISQFTLRILFKLSSSYQRFQQLQSQHPIISSSSSNRKYQLFVICKQYYKQRIEPLKVIINYMLPKMYKICKDYAKKQIIVDRLLQNMKYTHDREKYVDTIRQLTILK